MGKPIVRIVLDKDILPKLLPEGSVEGQLALDNNAVQLVKETAKRLVNEALILECERRFAIAIRAEFSASWRNCDVRKVVGDAVKEAAAHYVKQQYEAVYIPALDDMGRLIKKQLAAAKEIIVQNTSPERIEELLLRACAQIVKEAVK